MGSTSSQRPPLHWGYQETVKGDVSMANETMPELLICRYIIDPCRGFKLSDEILKTPPRGAAVIEPILAEGALPMQLCHRLLYGVLNCFQNCSEGQVLVRLRRRRLEEAMSQEILVPRKTVCI